MDFYQSLGYLIFGSRLRRLSEYYIGELNKVYQALAIPFDTSWFPFFYIFSTTKEISLIDLSNRLQISHSSVSQMINNLKQKKLVKTIKAKDDARKQLVKLTPDGILLLEKIKPVWEAIGASLTTIEQENPTVQPLLSTLSTLEIELKKQPLSTLILELLTKKSEQI